MKAIMSCGVYAIINVLTEIMYVGSSVEIENRWYGSQGHFTLLLKGDHDNSYLQAAFNKYGEEAFTFEILELTSEDNQFKREQHYIDLIGIKNLYNINSQAGGGRLDDETIEKIKRTMKGKNRGNQYAKGYNHTEETIEELRRASSGHSISTTTVKKIRESLKNFYETTEGREMKKKWSKANKGIPRLEETKKKISESVKANYRQKAECLV